MIAARSAGSDHAKTQNSNANESCQINTLPLPLLICFTHYGLHIQTSTGEHHYRLSEHLAFRAYTHLVTYEPPGHSESRMACAYPPGHRGGLRTHHPQYIL